MVEAVPHRVEPGGPTPGEYARFGPWVDEVASPDELPRLYREHPIDFASALLVVKVPRNIARRDARPEMDLYDHVVVLEPEHLTVLSRVVAATDRRADTTWPYDVRTVPVADVVAVRDVVSMLDAALSVHTRDGATITLRYNGSARANVDRLVNALRALIAVDDQGAVGRALLASAGASSAGEHEPDLGPADLSLVADFRAAARVNPHLAAWAWHGRRVVAPEGGSAAGVLRRLTHAISPMTLHGAVVGGDERVLEVFGRHEFLVRGAAPVHSSSRLVVPLGAVDGLTTAPHPGYVGAHDVVLTAGASSLGLVVPETSATRDLFDRAAADLR